MATSATKKILLGRGDDVAAVVDLVIRSTADQVVLVVPKGSVLGTSMQNFKVLAREAITARKTVSIESSDEHIRELAGLADLPTTNPVRVTAEHAFSDILPRGKSTRLAVPAPALEPKPEPARPVSPPTPVVVSPKAIDFFAASAPKPEPKPRVSFFRRIFPRKERRSVSSSVPPERIAPAASKQVPSPVVSSPRKRRSLLRRVGTFGIVIVVLAVLWYVGFVVLPQAVITIQLKTTTVALDPTVIISSVATVADTSSTPPVVPGELLVAKRNLDMSFTASSSQNASVKATGQLIVTNSFSAAPQILVQGTRFVSPDGHLFRLDQRTVIAGETVINGIATSSQTVVQVTADQPGDAWDIGPSTGWTIPGFQGTPRYAAFTAESPEAMMGGFIGLQATPSAADLAAAKATVEGALRDSLRLQMGVLLTDRFKLLDGASDFSVTNEAVQPDPKDPSKFSVFADGQARSFVFDESVLKDVLAARAGSSLDPTLRVRSVDITYGTSTPDFDAGTFTISITGTAVFQPPVDPQALTQELLGKDTNAFRAAMLNVPGLTTAHIDLSPFWVLNIPGIPPGST